MDVEGGAMGLERIEHGPVMLYNLAVCGALAEQCGKLRAVAANAEAADPLLSDGFMEEVEECVISEVSGFGFVQEPDVDEVGAKGAEAVFERCAGFVGGKVRFFRGCGDSACGSSETPLECRYALQHRADDASCCTQHAAAFWGSDAVLGGDGDVVVLGAQLAK